MTTSLYLGGREPSRLLLPTVPITSPLPAPTFQAVPAVPEHRANNGPWRVQRTLYDQPKPTIIEEGRTDYGPKQQWPWGSYSRSISHDFAVPDDHPELASYTGHNNLKVQLPGRELLWLTEWDIHGDKTNFYYFFKRELRENGKLIREKQWQETIARDHQ